MTEKARFPLHHYPHTLDIPVRWNEYDMVGVVNNVQFYAYIQEAVVSLLDRLGVHWTEDLVLPFVVESRCTFFAPLRYPSKVKAGIGIERLGNSSLTYIIGLFAEGTEQPVAQGHFVHVFADQNTMASCPIPAAVRTLAVPFVLS